MRKLKKVFSFLFVFAVVVFPAICVSAAETPTEGVAIGSALALEGGTILIEDEEDAGGLLTLKNISGKDIEELYIDSLGTGTISANFYLQNSEVISSGLKKGRSTELAVVTNASGRTSGGYSRAIAYYTIEGTDYQQEITVDFDLKVKPTPSPRPSQVPVLQQTETLSYVAASRGLVSVIPVTLENTSDFAVNDFSFEKIVSKNFSFEYDTSKFSIRPHSKNTIYFKVTPDKDIESFKDEIPVNYSYSNAYGDKFNGSVSLYISVDTAEKSEPTPEPQPAILTISDFQTSSDNIKNGENFTIKAKVHNLTETDARYVQVSITGLTTDGITAANSSSTIMIGDIKAKSAAEFSFSLGAAKKAAGAYPLKFSVAGVDYKGGAVAANVDFSVSIANENAEDDTDALANISVVSISSPQGQYDVGQNFGIAVKVRNDGKADAKYLKVTAAPEAGVVPKSASVVQKDIIKVGETVEMNFMFAPTSDAQSKNHVIQFDFSYEAGRKDGVAVKNEFSQYSSANINNSELDEEKEETENNKSVPKIIISDYKVTSSDPETPSIVLAGQEFDLYLQFKNTHHTKTISNIKVTLSSPTSTDNKGNTFSTVGASNTMYIDSIAPGATYEKTLRMYSILSAAAKNHIIAVHFEYEDEEGNAITQDEEVGVTVAQEAKLEIGTVNLPSIVMQNDMNYLNFSLQNTGRVTLYNMKVTLEGEGFDLAGTEVIIGNMASGAYNYYDGNFYGVDVGMHKLKVIVSYDLDTGKREVDEQVFDVEVVAAQTDAGFSDGGMFIDNGGMLIDDGMGFVEEEPTTISGKVKGFFKKIPVWVYVIAGIVVVGGASGAVIAIRRVRKKKGFDLDE
ncbi:MAG: hypothetical protein LBM16_05035 [Clostridiales bacterium]|jgi:hypothetical protein|nr:hypothetical protein [Clostridiales bacterium]